MKRHYRVKALLPLGLIPAAAFGLLAWMGAGQGLLWPSLIIGAAASAAVVAVAGSIITELQGELERRNTTDELTGTVTRPEFDRQLERSLARHSRHMQPVSLVLLDVDDFKTINEQLGRSEADRVLSRIAGDIRSNVRPDDVVARWGEDEFMLLLECSSEQAVRTAERLKGLLAHSELRVSIGISTYRDGSSADEFLKVVDDALLQSKQTGPDRITVA
jgi:diguanylate cyclase (GGDEF)-like protein